MANLGFIHVDKFCDDSGLTRGVIDGWMKRHWQSGVHYVVIGHQLMVNIEGVNQWITEHGQKASGQAGADYRSGSGAGKKLSTPKRLPVTPTMRVTSPLRSIAGTS